MLALYMKFFVRLRHMKIVAEIIVIPRKCHLSFAVITLNSHYVQ